MARKAKKQSKRLKQALSCVQRGWLVHPLHGIVNESCTCGDENCNHPGKHPLLPNGLKGASTDPDQIRLWWKQWAKANIGICTGAESGLVVLDVDPRHGGNETLSELIKKHGPLPETVCVNTGGGGQHFYFKHPGGKIKNRQNIFGKGLDFKADGGYVVAPPSLHVSGKKYKWENKAKPEDIDLADMPNWFVEQKPKRKSQENNITDKIFEGERNEKLAEKAGSLRGRGLSESEMLPVLLDVNANHCEPPLDESEVRGIAASIGSYPASDDENDSQATALVKLAEQVDLFHNPDQQSFARITVGSHQECWPLSSNFFETWLRGQHYSTSGKAAGTQAFQNALGVLHCQAIFDGKEENTYVRVAGVGRKLWIDLGDPEWRSVRITTKGWKMLKSHPTHFVRSKTTRALPVPEKGGRLDELREFLNLNSDNDWILMVSWLLGTLQPNGPYPLLVVTGEQGSAKSTICRVLRSLVDPQQPDLRSQPKDERDLMVSAARSWILAYDNLSKITPGMSDALCRLATGGGFATRQMYSDTEECVFDCKRPIILNGIGEIANRSDLQDRSIILTLPSIPQSKRQPESEYWNKFNELRPRIFGALLDVVCIILKRLDKVKLKEFPRMADFARWATAAEPALGFSQGSVMRAYQQKHEIYNREAVESSAVGPAIVKLMENRESWKGTSNDLLTALQKDYRLVFIKRQTDWPRTPRGMSSVLQRLAPNLRAMQIDVTLPIKQGSNGQRILTLRKIAVIPPAPPVKRPVKKRTVKVKVKRA